MSLLKITFFSLYLFLLVTKLVAQESQCPETPPFDNCKGTYIYPDGTKYIGTWKNGLRHGGGAIFDINGDIISKGFFYKNKLLSSLQKCSKVPPFDNCVGEYIYPDGTKYIGEWKNGKETEIGILISNNGTEIQRKKVTKSNSTKSLSKTEQSILIESYFKNNLTGFQRKLIQSNLKRLGHYRSTIDGLYGRGTKAAILDYAKYESFGNSKEIQKIFDKILKINTKLIDKKNNTAQKKYSSSSKRQSLNKAIKDSNSGNYRTSFQVFKKLAEDGYTPAYSALGFAYTEGQGTEENKGLGCSWYKKSYEALPNNSGTMNNLANCYFTGKGMKRDFKKAYNLYKKSAELGNDYAMMNTSFNYANGKGIFKDYTKSLAWIIMSIRVLQKKKTLTNYEKKVLRDRKDWETRLRKYLNSLGGAEVARASAIASNCIKKKYKNCGG